jgi:hypothetical protein
VPGVSVCIKAGEEDLQYSFICYKIREKSVSSMITSQVSISSRGKVFAFHRDNQRDPISCLSNSIRGGGGLTFCWRVISYWFLPSSGSTFISPVRSTCHAHLILCLDGCLLGCSALVTLAARSSETSVNFFQTARCHGPEDSHLLARSCENLGSYLIINLHSSPNVKDQVQRPNKTTGKMAMF